MKYAKEPSFLDAYLSYFHIVDFRVYERFKLVTTPYLKFKSKDYPFSFSCIIVAPVLRVKTGVCDNEATQLAMISSYLEGAEVLAPGNLTPGHMRCLSQDTSRAGPADMEEI